LAEAEDWYFRSRAILEELGDRPKMASSYVQIGILAQERGRLEEASDWYARSLAISEELGDRPGMAIVYGEFGLLAETQGNPGQALEWMVRCVTLFEQFPHPFTGPGPVHLARLTAQLGIPALEACWLRVTGDPLPETVRETVWNSPPTTPWPS
jgi:tetratricopeptide (TPR) repeat protein